MAEQQNNRSEDREDLRRYATWNSWRMQGGALRPSDDLPSVDDSSDSSSESDQDLSSSGSSESSSSEDSDCIVISASKRRGVLRSTRAHGLEYYPHTATAHPSGCYDCENGRDIAAGSRDSVGHWSTLDGSESTGECPCCIASACSFSGSEQQSKMIAYFQDPARRRAQIEQQLRERSRRCQEQRQQLLRTAIWNSWCAKSKALLQLPEAACSVLETGELPSLPHAAAHRACEDSPVVEESSYPSGTRCEPDSSSESDRASSGSSDGSEENEWVNAHCENSGVEEVSTSFSSSSSPDYVPLHDTSSGNSCSESEYAVSDETDYGWSDYEESEDTDECLCEMPSSFRTRQYYDAVTKF